MGGRRCCGNACVGAEALHRPEASRLLLAALSTMMALTATDAEGVSELLSFLKEDVGVRMDSREFSVLEIGNGIGRLMAEELPGVSWISASGDQQGSSVSPPNLIQVDKLNHERIRRMHRSPQIFEYLLISDFGAASSPAMSSESLGMLMGMARYTLVYVSPESGLTSMFTDKSIQKAAEEMIAAADKHAIGVVIKNVKGNILLAEVTSLVRPVQHHFDDRREASEGGTCFKYKLFHKTSPGVRSTPWLCQVKADPALKGPGAPTIVKDCPPDPQCAERTIDLKNSNWVNLKLLAGLGMTRESKQAIIDQFLKLPEFRDCPTWNVCVAGSSLVWCDSDAQGLNTEHVMSEHVNKGCARLDVGMKYDANPACCLDILMAALDEEHCGLSEAQAQSLNIGHAFSMNQVTDCRKKHLGNYFVPVHFKDSFLENAQESFVFGTGREPSRMTKEEIEEELRQLGISAEVQRDSSKNGLGNAKEQLIQRLEEARMDTSRLSAEQLDTELKAMGLAVDGPQGVKAARLQTARELAYKRVKSKLLKGRIKNRIEQIKKGVDDLSKDEMKDYLIEAGAQTNGEKKQLAGRLKQAWKKQPELKIKAIADLEQQLGYGDALYDIKMAEKEGKAQLRTGGLLQRLPAQAQPSFGGIGGMFGAAQNQMLMQPRVWDAGSIEDLGEDNGLGAQSVNSMSKQELQEEARASGMPAGGSKEELRAAVSKARRLGKSPVSKPAQRPAWEPEPIHRAKIPQFHSMGGAGYTSYQVNQYADQLLQSATFPDEHKDPEKMSRQDLIAELEKQSIPTAGLSKEKLIEAARKAGIQKSVKSIDRFLQNAPLPFAGGMPSYGSGWGGGLNGGGGFPKGRQQVMAGGMRGSGSLRERLMAREGLIGGKQGGDAMYGADTRRRRGSAPGSGSGSIAHGNLAIEMSKAVLEENLRRAGIQASGTKEELLDRLLTKMTKEEMVEQLQLMHLDTKGSKMELKQRIVANKEQKAKQ